MGVGDRGLNIFLMTRLLEKRSGTEAVSVKGRETGGKKRGWEEPRDLGAE